MLLFTVNVIYKFREFRSNISFMQSTQDQNITVAGSYLQRALQINL